MVPTIYSVFLYRVNIPGGVKLTVDEVNEKLLDVTPELSLLRCVGAADNILLQSSSRLNESHVSQLVQEALGVKGAVVVSLWTLREMLDAAMHELHARGFSDVPRFKIRSDGVQWEFGLVLSSEVLPIHVRGKAGLFQPKKERTCHAHTQGSSIACPEEMLNCDRKPAHVRQHGYRSMENYLEAS